MDSTDSCTFSSIPQVRRPKESLLRSLRAREAGQNRAKCPVIVARRLYRSIHPNTTLHGVDCQFSNLKKFTPCGQYLIGMSKNQRAVHIYQFKGSEGPPEERTIESLGFKDFFELKHETVVPKESELLSKDFCLVTANGRFDNGKMIDLHRIGWFNHDDDELVLARYRDFNEQYIAQQTIKSSSPYYHHGYSLKDEEMSDSRAKERFDPFGVTPTQSVSTEFSDAIFHQVPSSSGSNIGMTSRPSHISHSYVSQIAYNSQSLYHDEFANLTMWRMQFLDESTLLIKFGKLECVVGRPPDSTYQTAFFVFYDIPSTEILAVYDNASEELMKLYESWADQFCATAYTTAGKNKRHYSSTCANNIYAKDHLKKTQYGLRHARNGGTAQAIKRSLCVLPYSPQSLSDSPYLDQALFSYDEKVISPSDRQRLCQDFPIKFYLRGSGELRFKIHLFKPGNPNGGHRMSESLNSMLFDNGNNTNNHNGNANNNNNINNSNVFVNANINNITTGNGNGNNNMNHTHTGGSGVMMKLKRFATFIIHPFEPFIISVIQNPTQPTALNLHLYRSDAEPL
ncbi:acid phosphatase det1 [Mortierella claussenii]|nr:acid phosphatase det1 [Mortierella claussenii]